MNRLINAPPTLAAPVGASSPVRGAPSPWNSPPIMTRFFHENPKEI
jgi:hypothetical protein